MLNGKNLFDYLLTSSITKVNKSLKDLMIQAFFAGVFISFGAIGYFKMTGLTSDHGLGLFLGALIFPTGIIMITFFGAELFTSDTMAITGVFNRDFNIKKFTRMIFTVWLFNIIGAIFTGYAVSKAHILPAESIEKLIHVAEHKVTLPIPEMIWSAILCNIIVCAGVYMSYSVKEGISKTIILWFTITLFVLTGTEHSIANSFYLFAAQFLGAEITIGQIIYNLFFVSIGNMIGGMVIVSGLNFLIYRNKSLVNTYS